MRNTVLFILATFSFLISLGPALASDFITLNLPEKVIASAVSAMLPLKIDANSKNIQGDITIISISDMQLTDKHLASSMRLAGKNLAFVTEIAGHEIKLKVGAVEIDFSANAALRFDAKEQTLYVKPMINNVTASGDNKNGEIGKALIALLNGREFPVTMQKIEPLIAETGAKTITISTKITAIQAKQDMLQLQLSPTISSKGK